MTKQRTLKRRVRARMAKTGEHYTAARRVIVSRIERPAPVAPPIPGDFVPPAADEAVLAATGRGWVEWIGLIDEWGGAEHTHADIARWIVAEHGVNGWWAQSVTVGYERARGRRAPGQRPDGFSVSASRTIGVPVERLFEAFVDDSLRERWSAGATLRVRTAAAPRTARFDWEDGSTRIAAGFTVVSDVRSKVALAHERLPDAEAAEEMRAWWRERLGALKDLLEADAG